MSLTQFVHLASMDSAFVRRNQVIVGRGIAGYGEEDKRLSVKQKCARREYPIKSKFI